MKNKLLGICLLLLLFTQSLFATPTYRVTLNNIAYTTRFPLLEKHDTLYISLVDFSSMALIDIKPNESNSYILSTIKGDVLIYTNSRRYLIENKEYFLDKPTFSIDQQIYVPIELISDLDYPCTLDKEHNLLAISSLPPYSRNPDNPKRHLFKEAEENLQNLPQHTIAFSSSNTINALIDKATANKSYIAFVNNSLSQTVKSNFIPQFDYSPYNNMHVTFRKINTHVTPNTITETLSLPLKVKFSGYGTTLTIGNEIFEYPMLWATFYPSKSLTEQDITKTAETTIMRGIYEYYRNISDLRDDKFFSPFTVISSDRTNIMKHSAYSLALDGTETHYDICIYRVHPTGSIHYIVDIISK